MNIYIVNKTYSWSLDRDTWNSCQEVVNCLCNLCYRGRPPIPIFSCFGGTEFIALMPEGPINRMSTGSRIFGTAGHVFGPYPAPALKKALVPHFILAGRWEITSTEITPAPSMFIKTIAWNLHGVMVNVLKSDIWINEFKHQSHYYVHFRTNTIGKGMNSLILQLWVNCSSARMALALDNLLYTHMQIHTDLYAES